jgi:hypothetical protein
VSLSVSTRATGSAPLATKMGVAVVVRMVGAGVLVSTVAVVLLRVVVQMI